MADLSLKTVFYAAMGRIQKLEASKTDLALVFIMSEFITEAGGAEEMAKQIDRLERKWKVAQGEYARGEV